LLHRLTGQSDILVGTPASGRGVPAYAELVGYLVNPLAVRIDLTGEPSFGELLARVRQAAIGAFAHQEYPLPRLAGGPAGGRGAELSGDGDAGRAALFQTLFVLYRERDGERGLAALALGEGGVRCDVGGLALESLALSRRSSQLDLSLLMAELDDGLAGALQ